MADQTLGQKIKNFRKRAGMSQLELEAAIGASPGSISRMESGKVNPSKETLVKLVEILGLNIYDTVSIFDLRTDEFPKLVNLARKLNNLELEILLQKTVNEITNALSLTAATIFLVENGEVYAKTFTQSTYTQVVFKLLNRPYESLKMSLCDPKTKDNLIMKSILIKEPIVIHNFLDASHGVITDRLARILQRVVGLKSSINIPVILNNHVIASIFFSKNYIDDFTAELPVLKAFCEHVGQSIINARKYEDLKKKLEEYYNAK